MEAAAWQLCSRGVPGLLNEEQPADLGVTGPGSEGVPAQLGSGLESVVGCLTSVGT